MVSSALAGRVNLRLILCLSLLTAYDFDLRLAAFRAAKELGFKKGTLKEGVYAW